MVAGVVFLSGAFGGSFAPLRGGRRNMFENAQVNSGLGIPYLKKLGACPRGQDPLPNLEDPGVMSKLVRDGRKWWGGAVRRVIKEEGNMPGAPWFYKDTKACLLWPLWFNAFPRARWVIVRRTAADIVYSCMHTGFMRAFNNEEGWGNWVKTYERRFAEMRGARLNIREVWPQRMVNGDFEEIESIVDWLGLTWRRDKVIGFIKPALWKGGKKQHGHKGNR
jgi:hypothetical protein